MTICDRRYKSIIGDAINFRNGAGVVAEPGRAVAVDGRLEQSPVDCAARRERVARGVSTCGHGVKCMIMSDFQKIG